MTSIFYIVDADGMKIGGVEVHFEPKGPVRIERVDIPPYPPLHPEKKRDCDGPNGRNSNICVGSGCFGEECLSHVVRGYN